jgi:large repetitive protein
MAVTDYKFAGTAADGGGDHPWADSVDNAKADDTSYASFMEKSTTSNLMILSNYGFSSSDVPSGSTIDGIEVVIARFQAGTHAGTVDATLYLRNSSGRTGNNLASASTWPLSGDTPSTATYGGSTNKWGTSLSQSDIVATSFGIELAITQDGDDNLGRAYVDYIKIRVYYTEGGGATVKPHYYYLQQ